MNDKVKCGICGHEAHILASHIANDHKLALDDYAKQYGEFVSEAAKAKLRQMQAQADNSKTVTPIKALFGCQIGPEKIQTWAWKYPHATTPKSDPDYVFRPELVSLIVAAHENDKDKVLFTGQTGSGKSSAIIESAARLNVPFYRVNFDNEITKADFIGQYILKGDETIYTYGTLAKAMMEGAWLLIDEWDMGNPGVTAVLQAVLEGNPLMIADTGELIQPADGFRIFSTGNTIGQGDETGLYSGTQVQNFAQLDRFTLVDYVDYPDAKIESKIIQRKCNLTDDKLKKRYGVSEISTKDNSDSIIRHIVNTATLIRASFKKGEVTTTMSTRTLVNIGDKLLMFGDIKKAYQVAYLNKLNTEDRQFCTEIIQREWGV